MDRTDTEREAARVAFQLFEEEKYQEKIQELGNTEKRRLVIDLSDLRRVSSDLTLKVIRSPTLVLPVIDRTLNENIKRTAVANKGDCKVTFDGPFGANFITPRGLIGSYANQLVMVQGIVTRLSLVRPKLVRSVHYCEDTGRGHTKTYNDQYELETAGEAANGSNNAFPTKDQDGHALTPEFGLCLYKDQQTLIIQELPERAPTGQLPRSIEVVLEEDLVNLVKPGDRVNVVGVFKTIVTGTSSASGVFKGVVMARSVTPVSDSSLQPVVTGADIKAFKEQGAQSNILDTLAESLAPSIFGHSQIKKALILLMLGGVEKNLANGTHLRGDINILLIGDPSTAKSQLLRCVLNIAPLATNTTGRGSSGVGLTAAVTFDKDTGERHLEAGAMVIADRGIVCIDEFDKMNEVDRVAIHEVMEQQTVTIAKAGIHTSLNARCSVLAAANPVYGTYQKDLPPSKNITLPDSLLSRFDFLFIILDQQNSEVDRLISDRVLQNHSYTGSNITELGDLDTPVIEAAMKTDPDEDSPVFIRQGNRQLFHRNFLKKYFHYAKKQVKPELSEETSEYLTNCWVDLRSKESDRKLIMPITVRTLETLIRISTAVAKAHLSQVVQRQHCDEALKVLKFALYQVEESLISDIEMTEAAGALSSLSSSKSKRRKAGDSPNIEAILRSGKSPEGLKRQIFSILSSIEGSQTISIDALWGKLQGKGVQSREDLLLAVRALEQENKCVVSEEHQTVTLL